MISRRLMLLGPGALLAGRAGRGAAAGSALRVGVDVALFDSGFAQALTRGFKADTGIAVQLVPGPVRPMLDALDRGELDAAISNAPDIEARLENEGLVHDRRLVAHGEFVLVGPAPRGKAGAATGSVAEVLQRVRDAAPGSVTFLSAADGSAAHAAEHAAWREVRLAPATPMLVEAAPGSSLVAQARARGAYAVVERGAWLAQGGAPLVVLAQGEPLLRGAVHVMRAFRVNHPAGKIFVAWVAGPQGRRVVAAQRGYRVPGG